MKKKRLLSIILVLVMAHSLMTTNVFAGNQKDAYAEGTHSNHCICGIIDCNDNEHGKSLTWTGINSLSEITKDGNYYLKQDVTLDATWECSYNVNICLNGKTITGCFLRVKTNLFSTPTRNRFFIWKVLEITQTFIWILKYLNVQNAYLQSIKG